MLMVKMVCQVGMALMGLMVAVALPARKVHRVSVVLLGLRVRRVLPVLTARMVGMARTVRMAVMAVLWCLCFVPGAALL